MERILIIQTAFIGDVILATPLVEKLKNFYPKADIDFVLRKGNEGLLKGHPKIRKVLVWDKKNKYNSLTKLGLKIRQNRYDLLVNLQRFASSGLLTTSSKAKMKIGFSKNPFSFAFTHKLPHVIDKEMHEVHRNLSLIEKLTDSSFQAPVLYPSETDFKKVEALQQSGAYYCVAPASVWFTKQFPVEKWVEMIDQISQDMPVYLLGAPGDLDICAEIQEKTLHGNVRILAGELTFLQSAALMKGARMNYVNDSAPLHIASAVNAPVTAVFCSTIPQFGFGPLSQKSFVVETEESLECRPCGLHGKKSCPKGHFKCAMSINTTDILKVGKSRSK